MTLFCSKIRKRSRKIPHAFSMVALIAQWILSFLLFTIKLFSDN